MAKVLRQHGVIILGKVGLSEWANSFGSQPSGFSNLTGQVLNAYDTAARPSGSSSGSAAAAAAGLATLTIGTETAATNAASIVPYEFHRDLDSYLSSAPEGTAKSL